MSRRLQAAATGWVCSRPRRPPHPSGGREMSSTSKSFKGRSTTGLVDASTRGPALFGDLGRQRHLVRAVVGDSEAVLACAATAMARAEREIDELWRDSMSAKDRATSQRLAEVSHALQRATRLLEYDDAIG